MCKHLFYRWWVTLTLTHTSHTHTQQFANSFDTYLRGGEVHVCEGICLPEFLRCGGAKTIKKLFSLSCFTPLSIQIRRRKTVSKTDHLRVCVCVCVCGNCVNNRTSKTMTIYGMDWLIWMDEKPLIVVDSQESFSGSQDSLDRNSKKQWTVGIFRSQSVCHKSSKSPLLFQKHVPSVNSSRYANFNICLHPYLFLSFNWSLGGIQETRNMGQHDFDKVTTTQCTR